MDDKKFKASVKVMRSYDYCHFEAALSSDQEMMLDEINEMRKQAALLVDEAVRQYSIAKKKESSREQKKWDLEAAIARMKRLKEKPVEELTPEEAALLRAYEDDAFWKEYDEDDYYYQDDPERDYHFSMLRKFQKSMVKV
jgi:hypothetical protein